MKIKDLKNGDEFVGFYLIKNIEIGQTNTTPPKPYLDIILADSTGNIAAKYWDASKDDIDTYGSMCIVKVQGSVQVYRDKLQVKILKIRKATEQDEVKITQFIHSAPIESTELTEILRQTIASIQSEELKAVVAFCVNKVEDKLHEAPAAKAHHHAYYGGLLYHIVRMLELGDFICTQRPFLNRAC